MCHLPIIISAIFLLFALIPDTDAITTIYDVLRSNSLPVGLLPKGVHNFSIDAETGRFQVFLDRECNAKFEDHVRYDFNVSGTISYGKIGSLSGITAQELFLWLPVKGIRVDVPSSGLIYFDVGVVFRQFPLSLFEIPPDCVDSGPPENLLMDIRSKPNGDEALRGVS